MACTTTTLAGFPEELLERILAFVVVAPPTAHPRAPWHPSPNAASSETPIRTRTAALLVSRAFHRIALPLFYHTLVLHTPSQSRGLLAALGARPALTRCVRTLVLSDPSPADADLLVLVGSTLRALDVTLPPVLPAIDALALEHALARPLPALRALAIRKAAGTYLSQPAPRAVLCALADTVAAAPLLEETTTSFPLSADPALAPLVDALAAAPVLHTLRTPLPALWAPPLLGVSANPALKQICLAAGEDAPCPVRANSYSASYSASAKDGGAGKAYADLWRARPIVGTGLFLAAARKHAHLSELIRAGTPIIGWRGRAWTVGADAREVQTC
ncbi:hypothetical protein B0H17DRAFT_1193184 [Mycena rosella]|uniref:Uncharacterized protein n=1 Tax=Mycena rosella TaxID=1033263 RepID=A0AAD7M8F7_MYCRO|nr:hypothetical protein B0H17DRAFT_1193184 [Mycena rosella]